MSDVVTDMNEQLSDDGEVFLPDDNLQDINTPEDEVRVFSISVEKWVNDKTSGMQSPVVEEDTEDDDLDLEEFLRVLDDIESDSDREDEPTPQQQPFKITRQERIRMLALRQFLNKLDDDVKEADICTAELREELERCHEKIKNLNNDCNTISDLLQTAEEENNKAAMYRLQSQYTKLCVELSSEKELETSIADNLRKSELDLAKVQLERSKYILLNDELEKQETALKDQKAEVALMRAHKEKEYGKATVRYLKTNQRMEIAKAHEDELRIEQTAIHAKLSRKRAQKFLQETLERLKKEAAKNEKEARVQIERRMNSVQSLKKRIEATHENMRAVRARDMQNAYEEHLRIQKEREIIRQEGGNPDVEMLRKQRLQKFEEDKKIFEEKKRQQQVKIVKKLVREEEGIRKRQQQQPYLFKQQQPSKPRQTQTMQPLKIVKQLAAEMNETSEYRQRDDSSMYAQSSDDDDAKESMDKEHQEALMDDADELEAFAVPEFQGMWNQKVTKRDDSGLYASYNAEQPNDEEPHLLENDELDDKYAKMIQKQIVTGREFKGKAFSSNPDVIVFKDFDIGKVYKQTVQLTNVSYSINSVKLLDVSRHLKDFIEIKFNPPGYMSAGLTCKMMVIFSPKINENLEGEIKFLAQTGPFSIPLRIYRKKCELKVNVQHVDFEQLCIGEKRVLHVVLTNDGALDTEYEVKRVQGISKSESKLSSIGRLTTVVSEHDVDRREFEEGNIKPSLTFKSSPTFLKSISFKSLPDFANKKEDKSQDIDRKVDVEFPVEDNKVPDRAIEGSSEAIALGSADKAAQDVSPTHMQEIAADGELQEDTVTTAITGPTPVAPTQSGDGITITEKETVAESQSVAFSAEEDKSAILSDITEKEDGLSGDESPSRSSNRASVHTILSAHTVSESTADTTINKSSLIQLGENAKGHIDSFSKLEIELNFCPVVTGEARTEFEISFSDPESAPIRIFAQGRGIDVAVWVKREIIDLNICMVDRLYQDSVIVNNRATSALRLRFDVPKVMQDHLEILPRHGIVQAESSFSAQLKFLPRKSIFDTCKKYVNPDSGEMNVPIIIKVADQTRPVLFSVKGQVTYSDIKFSVENVNFGYCSINESVISSIKIENKSALPQPFGFIGLHDYVEVQPSDGFGTLLPFEILELDVIFSPRKAGEYAFELICKTGIDRKFKLPCKAIGVLPPLQLSANVIKFAATAINDTEIATIFVENTHLDKNQFTHPVPRIGKGTIADVGPTSFEFVIPEDCPLTISPNVGTVDPGQRLITEVRFAPRLDSQRIQEECGRIAIEMQETKRKEEERRAADLMRQEMEETSHAKKKKKGSFGKRPISPKSSSKVISNTPTTAMTKLAKIPPVATTDKSFNEKSDEYAAATLSLLRSFESCYVNYTIPCFIASGSVDSTHKLQYSIYNTLYLEIHGAVVRPALVVISNNGRNEIDYESVSIGESETKTIAIQNISNSELKLHSSVLDTGGPFHMVNALRTLQAGAIHTVSITFTPMESTDFLEILDVISPLSKLSIRLQGKGVAPSIQLSVPNNILDFGNLLVNDAIAETFKITNISLLPVTFLIKQDSIFERNKDKSSVRSAVAKDKKIGENTPTVGPANYSGLCVFDCSPIQGTIKPGATKEITVTFSPDHPSKYYSDLARIVLFDNVRVYHLRLIGKSWPMTLYALGGDRIEPTTESLSVSSTSDGEEDQKGSKKAHPILLTFKSWFGKTGYMPVSREIELGCVRTVMQSTKKIGEFWFDDLHAAGAKGFSVDPSRGGLDPGVRRNIVFTWTPPAGHNPNIPVEFDITMTLKDYGTENYKIMLRGMVITA